MRSVCDLSDAGAQARPPRRRCLTRRISSVLSMLVLGLMSTQGQAADRPAPAYPSELLQPHLVTLQDGRHFNIFCIGKGSPTVVFEQGLGGNVLHWKDQIGPVSKLTRACVYDRAGYGFSDAPTQIMNAVNITSDLHALLAAAGVRGPVVLVGHSIGGLYATLYADRFSKEVTGLVLVDPSFAGQKGVTPETPEEVAMAAKMQSDQDRQKIECAALARQHALDSADPRGCIPPTREGRPPNEVAFVRALFTRPGMYEAVLSEQRSFGSPGQGEAVDSREEREAARRFGAMPVIVLSHGDGGQRPSFISKARWDAGEADWLSGHEKLAARSTRGKHEIVSGAGHYIQLDKPEVVTEAISEVIQQARGR